MAATPEQINAAVLLNGNLRRQIELMHTRDGLGPEEIAECLGVQVGLVALALKRELNAAKEVAKQEGGDAAAQIERTLKVYEDNACHTLGTLLDSSNEAIQLTAAREILAIRGGKLRPAKPAEAVGFTSAQMQDILASALSAYDNMRQQQAPMVPTIVHPTQDETRLLELPQIKENTQ
jgi:hypothetical protein